MFCNKNMHPLFEKNVSSQPPSTSPQTESRKPATRSTQNHLIIIAIENYDAILANIVIYKYKTCIFRSISSGFSIQILIVGLYR